MRRGTKGKGGGERRRGEKKNKINFVKEGWVQIM